MSGFWVLIQVNLKAVLRDRTLRAILGVMVVALLLVPSMSSFSMRQVQELSISLSLSCLSSFLLIVAILFGSSSVWRDIENRYTVSVMTLPVSRTAYVFAKFSAITIFLVVLGCVLGACSAIIVYWASAGYPADQPILWGNFFLALFADIMKSTLVAAIAIFFSTVSTSFYLPFFASIAIYLCGSSSQGVYEYITGTLSSDINPAIIKIIEFVYYLLPNFSSFNYKVQAIYSLPLHFPQIGWTVLYGLFYLVIVLGMSVFTINKRILEK